MLFWILNKAISITNFWRTSIWVNIWIASTTTETIPTWSLSISYQQSKASSTAQRSAYQAAKPAWFTWNLKIWLQSGISITSSSHHENSQLHFSAHRKLHLPHTSVIHTRQTMSAHPRSQAETTKEALKCESSKRWQSAIHISWTSRGSTSRFLGSRKTVISLLKGNSERRCLTIRSKNCMLLSQQWILMEMEPWRVESSECCFVVFRDQWVKKSLQN